jgi:hypothetical protein
MEIFCLRRAKKQIKSRPNAVMSFDGSSTRKPTLSSIRFLPPHRGKKDSCEFRFRLTFSHHPLSTGLSHPISYVICEFAGRPAAAFPPPPAKSSPTVKRGDREDETKTVEEKQTENNAGRERETKSANNCFCLLSFGPRRKSPQWSKQ